MIDDVIETLRRRSLSSHGGRRYATRILLVVGSVLAASLPPSALAQTATACGPEVKEKVASAALPFRISAALPADGLSDERSDAASEIDSVLGTHTNRLQLHADLGKCAELPYPPRSIGVRGGSHRVAPSANRQRCMIVAHRPPRTPRRPAPTGNGGVKWRYALTVC
jgi:hypothetical protein